MPVSALAGHLIGEAQRGGERGKVLVECSAAEIGGALEVVAHGALRQVQPPRRFRRAAPALQPGTKRLTHPASPDARLGEAAERVRDELLGRGRAAPDEGLYRHVLVAHRARRPAQRDLEGEQRLLVAGDEAGDADGRLADADPAAEAVEGLKPQALAIAPRPARLRDRGDDEHGTDVRRAQDGAEPLGAGTACRHPDVRPSRPQPEARLVEGPTGEDGADGGQARRLQRLGAAAGSGRVSGGQPRNERLGEGGHQGQPLSGLGRAVGPAHAAGDEQLLQAGESDPVAGEQVGQRQPAAAGQVAGGLAPRHLRIGHLRPLVDHPRGERLDEPSCRPPHLIDLLRPAEQLWGVHSLPDGVDHAGREVVGVSAQAFRQVRPPHDYMVAFLPDSGNSALNYAAIRLYRPPDDPEDGSMIDSNVTAAPDADQRTIAKTNSPEVVPTATAGASMPEADATATTGAATPGRIVVIGAAGEMTRVAVERLAAFESDQTLVLADLDEATAHELAAGLPPGRATATKLDLFDEQQLAELVSGARLVVNGAGPYMRTAEPVMRACIAAGVDYVDLDDDNASTLQALNLHEQAKAAGVALFIGCGASPGLTNVLALDAASRLDEVETIDVAWCVGDEGPRSYGRAVVEHLIDIAAGDCLTWRDSRRGTVPSYVDSDVVYMAGGLGDYRLYEVAHPEAVTLPGTFPKARRIRCLGGMYPQPVNGVVRGIGAAMREGRLTLDESIEFFQAVMQDQNGSLKGWRHALRGIAGQLRGGDVSAGELGRFVLDAARKHHAPFLGAVAATATGRKDGARATVHLTVGGTATASGLWTDMAAATGRSLAAFVRLALQTEGLAGTLPPEAWCEPARFYDALQAHGAAPEEVRPADLTAAPVGTPTEAATARARLAADIGALSAIRRPSCSPGEERAAKWVAARMAEAGLRAHLEHFSGHGGYWRPLGLPLALCAALVSRRSSRLAWAAAAVLPPGLIVDEVGGHRRLLRRLLPHRRGTSVCAEVPGAGDDVPTVIVVAHLDAAHTGLIFHPRWASLSARVMRRLSDRTPPTAATLLAGPALAALAAAAGSRRLARASLAASLLGVAAMADVARRGISPGANDNASGVAVLLELARSLARQPARARVLLVASGGEESFDEGFEAFLDRRLGELDPARTLVLCVDTVGNPEHVLLDGEGMVQVRRYPGEWNDWALGQAASAGIPLRRGLINHSGTDGLVALTRGLPAISLHSLADDGSFGAYHWPNDTLENLDVDAVERAAALCRVILGAAPSGPFTR